jgi:hypothetical protein
MDLKILIYCHKFLLHSFHSLIFKPEKINECNLRDEDQTRGQFYFYHIPVPLKPRKISSFITENKDFYDKILQNTRLGQNPMQFALCEQCQVHQNNE